jgi:hypothetical protein
MLDVIFGQASSPGKLRPNNEDAMAHSFQNPGKKRNRMVGCLSSPTELAAWISAMLRPRKQLL